MEDWTQWLYIGCTGDEPWRDMHVPGVRYLTFTVRFREAPAAEEPDLRHRLAELWQPLLLESKLCASIGHQSPHTQHGATPAMIGFVWRQIGGERLESMTDSEFGELRAVLVANAGQLSRFSLTELLAGEQHGNFDRVRCWRLDDAGISETIFKPAYS